MKRVEHNAAAAVTTRAATRAASAANVPVVDVRIVRGVRAGAFIYDGPAIETRWHRHELHQLEYATRGAVGVASSDTHFVCPPHEVLWISAGTPHRSLLGAARTISVFFAPELAPNVGVSGVRVLKATPLLREMVAYAARWRIDRADSDALADAYFSTMGALLPEWVQLDGPWTLPVSAHPAAAAALAFTVAHLADATPRAAARAAGVSERGLRRLFASEVGISWSAYLSRARLLQAMTLLSTTDYTVLRIANEVGFESATALTRALRSWTDATPSQYRARSAG